MRNNVKSIISVIGTLAMRMTKTMSSVVGMVRVVCCALALVTLETEVGFAASPPIYVSIVVHIEENPDYASNPAIFWNKRNEILYLANMLHEHGIKLNFQSDWNFLKATALYDTGDGTTYGLDIVRYMHDSLDFEIDPHAHQTSHNYADVAHYIEDLGLLPTNVAGGFIVAPPEDSELEEFFTPIESDSFPGYFWEAEIVWGGSHAGHGDDSLLWASGLWKPLNSEHFFIHSDAGPVINVGNYCPEWRGLYDLLEQGSMGLLDTTKMFTVGIILPQHRLTYEQIDAFEDTICEFEDSIGTGRIIFATLQEIVDIWRTEYDSIPNIYRFIETTIRDFHSAQPVEITMRAFPNPFNSSCAISAPAGAEIEIYDLRGKVVGVGLVPALDDMPANSERATTRVAPANRTFIWAPDASLPSGIYFVRARAQDGREMEKRVVLVR